MIFHIQRLFHLSAVIQTWFHVTSLILVSDSSTQTQYVSFTMLFPKMRFWLLFLNWSIGQFLLLIIPQKKYLGSCKTLLSSDTPGLVTCFCSCPTQLLLKQNRSLSRNEFRSSEHKGHWNNLHRCIKLLFALPLCLPRTHHISVCLNSYMLLIFSLGELLFRERETYSLRGPKPSQKNHSQNRAG